MGQPGRDLSIGSRLYVQQISKRDIAGRGEGAGFWLLCGRRRRECGSCVFIFKQSLESRFCTENTQSVSAKRRQHFLCKRVLKNCSWFQVGSSLQVRRQTGEGDLLMKLIQTDTHADKK